MKKILLFFVAMSIFSINTQAQTTAKEDAEHTQEGSKGEKMKALLSLSDEQLVKFREVVLERRNAIKAIKEDATLSEAAKEAKIKTINDAREAKFKTIFSAEQFTKWVEHNNAKKKD
jgi:exopolysaccharide biosynthesis protein